MIASTSKALTQFTLFSENPISVHFWSFSYIVAIGAGGPNEGHAVIWSICGLPFWSLGLSVANTLGTAMATNCPLLLLPKALSFPLVLWSLRWDILPYKSEVRHRTLLVGQVCLLLCYWYGSNDVALAKYFRWSPITWWPQGLHSFQILISFHPL